MSELSNDAYERVEDARIVLETLGMDAERSNERSALVLLALLRLTPAESWAEAANPMLGTRAIMDFIRDEYGKDYAPNTRETVRRFTLHQFVEAQLVVQNPDEPQRPVNSPKWNYQVTGEALDVLRAYGTDAWQSATDRYLADLPSLKARYAAAREMDRIPLTLPDGSIFTLTPGGQNVLLKAMVEDFCPRFTPGGQVLYIGDAGDKWALFEERRCPRSTSRSTSTARCPTSSSTSPTATGSCSWKQPAHTAPSTRNAKPNSPTCSHSQRQALSTSPASLTGQSSASTSTRSPGSPKSGALTTPRT